MAKVKPFDELDQSMDMLKKTSMWKTEVNELKQLRTSRIRDMPEYRNLKGIIFPDDKFLSGWNIVLILILGYTAIVTPYRIAFSEDDGVYWIITDLIVDFLFFCDVVVNCFLAYYDYDMNLVVDKRKILLAYFKGWMVFDVIACIPVQFLLETEADYSSLVRIIRLPRLYRLIKMTKFLKHIINSRHRNGCTKWYKRFLHISPTLEKLIWFVVTFILMIHIFSCIWIFIGKLYSNSHNTWINSLKLNDYSNFDLYTTSFYWAVTTLATVGYGDIHAFNTHEMIACCFVMLIGVCSYSYTIGSITALISNFDSHKAKMKRKLEILHDLAKEYKLNKLFYKKLTKAIEYDNKRKRADLDELLNDLPVYLRTQLLIIIYQKMLENNVFFENKPPYFVAWVAPLLKPLRVDKGEYIYKAGELATEMYFLVSGEVAMVIQKGEVSIPFLQMFDGYYFGEIDLLFTESKQHMYSIRAMTKCELLTLSKIDFEIMLRQFETEALDILSRAKERLERTKEKHELAEVELKEHSIVRRYTSIPKLEPAIPAPVALWNLRNMVKDQKSNEKEKEEEKELDHMSESDDLLNNTPIPSPRSFHNPDIITSTKDHSIDIPENITPHESLVSSMTDSQMYSSREGMILKTNTLFKTFVDEKLGIESEEIKEIKLKIKSMEKSIHSISSMIRMVCETLSITDLPHPRFSPSSGSVTPVRSSSLSLQGSLRGYMSPRNQVTPITNIEEAKITEEHEDSSTY
jgi:CRP-like cAMP-binding protein